MELILKFDVDNRKELRIFKAIGAAIMVANDAMTEEYEEKPIAPDEPVEEMTEEVHSDVTTEKPAAEEQPKKRTRKKKEEPKPAEEEQPSDSDLPFDNEPEAVPTNETAAPQFPKMTKDEWSELNHQKREELGLAEGGAHRDLVRDFNVYCQKNSELVFGNPKPSTLSEEDLWRYAEWFKTIELNPDYIPGSTNDDNMSPFRVKCPF